MTHDPNLPPRQREPEHEVFDLTAILADERAVEMLRAHAGDPEDLDDRMLMLLAALARDARGTSTSSAEPVTPRRKTQRRRLSQRARGTVSGAVLTVSLFGLGGGVAAAVAGNPLAGIDGLRTAATAAGLSPDEAHPLRLSNKAREVRTQVAQAERAASKGDREGARKALAAAAAAAQDLSETDREAVAPQVLEAAASMGATPTDPATSLPPSNSVPGTPPSAVTPAPASGSAGPSMPGTNPTQPAASQPTPGQPTPAQSGSAGSGSAGSGGSESGAGQSGPAVPGVPPSSGEPAGDSSTPSPADPTGSGSTPPSSGSDEPTAATKSPSTGASDSSGPSSSGTGTPSSGKPASSSPSSDKSSKPSDSATDDETAKPSASPTNTSAGSAPLSVVRP